MQLQLVPVTRANLGALCALDAGDGGRQVAPNQQSMAQAAVYAEAWPRGIVVDGVLAGFVMLYDPTLTPDPEEQRFTVWRLMIDRTQQGRGIGRRALMAVIEHVRTRPGAQELFISYVPPEPRLVHLYGSVGFVATGEIDDGEVVMRLAL